MTSEPYPVGTRVYASHMSGGDVLMDEPCVVLSYQKNQMAFEVEVNTSFFYKVAFLNRPVRGMWSWHLSPEKGTSGAYHAAKKRMERMECMERNS